MLEMRWVKDDQGYMQLQQRKRDVVVDGFTGAFARFTNWSEWEAVSVVQDFFEFKEVKEVPIPTEVNAGSNGHCEASQAIGLTSKETEAMEHLTNFWNAYLSLPDSKGTETTRTICDAIHVIQGVMAIRVARRVNPEFWI